MLNCWPLRLKASDARPGKELAVLPWWLPRIKTPLQPGGPPGNLIQISRAISNWWGRKDSNLRSHEAADLQSAPFATRDTPPGSTGIRIRNRATRDVGSAIET